jgi:hypothetical protein
MLFHDCFEEVPVPHTFAELTDELEIEQTKIEIERQIMEIKRMNKIPILDVELQFITQMCQERSQISEEDEQSLRELRSPTILIMPPSESILEQRLNEKKQKEGLSNEDAEHAMATFQIIQKVMSEASSPENLPWSHMIVTQEGVDVQQHTRNLLGILEQSHASHADATRLLRQRLQFLDKTKFNVKDQAPLVDERKLCDECDAVKAQTTPGRSSLGEPDPIEVSPKA